MLPIMQNLLDSGLNQQRVEKQLSVPNATVRRFVKQGKLEIYKAFDEEDNKHLYQNFEWLWEEDVLERITDAAFFKPIFLDKRDEDILAVSRYVKQEYGNLRKYLIRKRLRHLENELLKLCSYCNEYQTINEFYTHPRKFMGLDDNCKKCNYKQARKRQKENPERLKAWSHNRRAMEQELPHLLNEEEVKNILNDFSSACSITGEKTYIDMDHFIPLSWGHGGSYHGNIYPLSASLNRSKSDSHPNIWFEKSRLEYVLSINKWNRVVRYLASANGLNVEEYKSFVNWCYENQRTVDEVQQDQRPSIEIWREATGLQFPIRIDFAKPNEIGNRLETA